LKCLLYHVNIIKTSRKYFFEHTKNKVASFI